MVQKHCINKTERRSKHRSKLAQYNKQKRNMRQARIHSKDVIIESYQDIVDALKEKMNIRCRVIVPIEQYSMPTFQKYNPGSSDDHDYSPIEQLQSHLKIVTKKQKPFVVIVAGPNISLAKVTDKHCVLRLKQGRVQTFLKLTKTTQITQTKVTKHKQLSKYQLKNQNCPRSQRRSLDSDHAVNFCLTLTVLQK